MSRNVLVAIAAVILLGAYVILATTRNAMHIPEPEVRRAPPPPVVEDEPPPPVVHTAPIAEPDDPERRKRANERRDNPALGLPDGFPERRAGERRA